MKTTLLLPLLALSLVSLRAESPSASSKKPDEKVIYLGIDTTAESLHIGHLFLLIQTIRFAQEGFTVLLVLGGATSKIGDPSDKDKERPLLEEKQIENYQEKIKSQLERILIKPKKVEKLFALLLLTTCSIKFSLAQTVSDSAHPSKWTNHCPLLSSARACHRFQTRM